MRSGERADAHGIPRSAGDREEAERNARAGAHCVGREAWLLGHPEERHPL